MASQYDEIMKTKPFLPFNMEGNLTQALKLKAKEELGETEEIKAKAIPQLRKMILDEPGLVCPTDDAYLLQHLRPKKFHVKRAFSIVKNYFEVKKSNRDMFGIFGEEERVKLIRAMGLKAGFFLPYRDKDGCAIALFRFENWDVDVLSAKDAVRAMCALVLACIQEPATQVCGLKCLVDVRGVNLRQIKSVVPYAYLITRAFWNCLPIRFKGIHIYHQKAIFLYLWSIMKLFMPEKIRNRIHLHGDNLEELHKYIPKEILSAKHYDGDNPNDPAEWFSKEGEKYFEIFEKLVSYGYRE